MRQRHLEEKLYDYITGRMKENDRRLAERHLKECEECRQKAKELTETLKLLEQLQPTPLSEETKQKARQHLKRLPMPPKPLIQRIKEWMHAPYSRLPLKGLAAAALAVLAVITITVYKGLAPQIDTAPRDIKITITAAKNPIIIETDNVEASLTRLEGLFKLHNGRLIGKKDVDIGIEAAFSIDKSAEAELLQKLAQTENAQIEKEGFKDKDGNIIVLLVKR